SLGRHVALAGAVRGGQQQERRAGDEGAEVRIEAGLVLQERALSRLAQNLTEPLLGRHDLLESIRPHIPSSAANRARPVYASGHAETRAIIGNGRGGGGDDPVEVGKVGSPEQRRQRVFIEQRPARLEEKQIVRG